MLNVYRPQPLYAEHAHERLIAADVSLKGRRIHLHPAAAYPDFAAPLADLELRAGGRVLPGQAYGSPHPLAYAYELPAEGAVPDSAQVWLRGAHAGRVRLKNGVPGGRVRLTAATLFKGDYPQLRAWVEHHAALGFERFVLYYNGEAEAILPELTACTALALHDLLLVSWPYSYWVQGTGLGVEGTLAEQGDRTDIARLAAAGGAARDWHHAQQMMLDHALVLLRGSTEFVGFFDLDEYFSLPAPGGLPQMLAALGQDVYIFQSRWAELADGAVPGWADGGDFLARHPVWAAPDWVPFPGRTKTIARPEVIHGMGAHLPKVTTAGARVARVPPEAGGIYHFHCFSGKASRRALVNPAGRWVPVARFGGPGTACAVPRA